MKGFIIAYNTDDVLRANNRLFGRVARIFRNNNYHYYYYKGLLDDIFFLKLANGCYFISDMIPENDDTFTIYSANINIDVNNMITAREYFREKYSGLRVKNIDKD